MIPTVKSQTSNPLSKGHICASLPWCVESWNCAGTAQKCTCQKLGHDPQPIYTLDLTLHLPAPTQDDTAAPVILFFHGYGGKYVVWLIVKSQAAHLHAHSVPNPLCWSDPALTVNLLHWSCFGLKHEHQHEMIVAECVMQVAKTRLPG